MGSQDLEHLMQLMNSAKEEAQQPTKKFLDIARLDYPVSVGRALRSLPGWRAQDLDDVRAGNLLSDHVLEENGPHGQSLGVGNSAYSECCLPRGWNISPAVVARFFELFQTMAEAQDLPTFCSLLARPGTAEEPGLAAAAAEWKLARNIEKWAEWGMASPAETDLHLDSECKAS